MCLSPVVISRPNLNRGRPWLFAPRYDKYQALAAHIWWRNHDHAYLKSLVPCGKCSECLSRRQSDLSARCAHEAWNKGSMIFVTLTYQDRFLPLSLSIERVDKCTGETDYPYKSVLMDRPKVCKCSIKWPPTYGFQEFHIHTLKSRLLTRNALSVSELYEDDDFVYRYVVARSVCNDDVRKWLMRCRVQFERKTGLPLPESWSYVRVSEYGNKRGRPHYHLAFFGLDKSVVDFFVSLWSYGFTYVQKVNAVNSDGSSGFNAASKYIGKYMSKGDFEIENVKDGFARKGRLCASKFFGGSLHESLVEYYRCYDVLGCYDINYPLPEDKLKILMRTLKERTTLDIAGIEYIMPRRYFHQVWYNFKKGFGYQVSIVRKQISESLYHDYCFGDYESFLKMFPRHGTPELAWQYAKMQAEMRETVKSYENDVGMLHHKKFYLTSKF